MDKQIEDYLNNLADKCLSSSHFSALGEDEKVKVKGKIRAHFSNIVMDYLLDNITVDQFTAIEKMDTKSQEFQDKIALIAGSIPNFANIMEQKLNDEATRITQTGHVPG